MRQGLEESHTKMQVCRRARARLGIDSIVIVDDVGTLKERMLVSLPAHREKSLTDKTMEVFGVNHFEHETRNRCLFRV